MVVYFRAALRLFLYLWLTLLIIPLQWLAVTFRTNTDLLPMIYQRWCLHVMGVKLRITGAPPVADGPILFVANHSSYMDIMVLGSQIKGSFIAKSEIAKWPWFGFLARLQQTLFIKRERGAAAEQKAALQALIARGRNLILFPEGTTSDGNHVLPFKSSLFTIANEVAMIQPVVIAFTGLDGLPPGRTWRPVYAWMGDSSLVPHLWQVLKQGELQVDLVFTPPLSTKTLNRKTLAQAAETAVRSTYLALINGQPLPATQYIS